MKKKIIQNKRILCLNTYNKKISNKYSKINKYSTNWMLTQDIFYEQNKYYEMYQKNIYSSFDIIENKFS